MLAAVEKGDAKELAKLMGQDPGFDVNEQDEDGWTFLHLTCAGDSRSAVIPILLAHPDIDVNLKTNLESTPFMCACYNGYASCARQLLKDSRVKVNERDKNGETPLRCAAYGGYLDVIKWWIASGREMDLGKPGDVDKTDAIGGAKESNKTEVVTLLERFKENPE